MAEKNELKLIEIETEDVKALMEYYGYEDKIVLLLGGFVSNMLRSYIVQFYAFDYLGDLDELISAVKFFKSCDGSELKLTSTITKPKGNELKGQVKTITISSAYLKLAFRLFVDTLLNEHTEIFGVERKQDIKIILPEFGFGIFPMNFCIPFTNAEIDKIEAEYNKFPPKKKCKSNAKLGGCAAMILHILKMGGIDKSNNTKTKLYSFVFDLMRLGGITCKKGNPDKGFSGDAGREKLQYVTGWLKACEEPVP